MADIKLFVACHRPVNLPANQLLHPIQVGTALTSDRFPHFLYDDNGENISLKNRSYCELTAQYWAWKNESADYLGFFHYRRFLYPDPVSRLPYCLKKSPNDNVLSDLGYSSFPALIEKYDLIAPIPENMHISVREHYIQAFAHRAEDLQLIEDIIRHNHPSYISALNSYFSNSCCYFGNIYIMRQRIFHSYCEWLFPILEEFERRSDFSGSTSQEIRAVGYLAERLFGVWLTHNRHQLQVCELPRVHFIPDGSEYLKKYMLNTLLPPGSRRRAFFKSFRSSLLWLTKT